MKKIQWTLTFVAAATVFLLSCSYMSAEEQAPYKDPVLPIEQRVQDLVKRMTLTEKVVLATGGVETVAAIQVPGSTDQKYVAAERLHIPVFKIVHGPYGFKGKIKPDEPRVTGTYFPVSIAQAATWDTELVEAANAAMGAEMHAAGGHANAGPAMNIIRDPRTGRSFEYFTEDPYLNGQIAVAYTKGLQSQKVMANLKHYVANNQELGRGGLDVIVSERALREIYLPGFKAAIQEGGAWSVMGAYNKVNGLYCCANPWLLNEVLRNEWGFKGFVLSDWSRTPSTEAANTGLDMEMPRERWYGKKLIAAVESGNVSQETIDTMASNILRGLFWTGAFDEKPSFDKSIVKSPEHLAVARQASASGMVLLKNERGVLPFDRSKIKKLAVIGPNGASGPHYNNGDYKPQLLQGGGSSRLGVSSEDMITPLEGIQSKVEKQIKVSYAPGCYAESGCGPIPAKYLRTPDGKNQGLLGRYYGNSELQGDPTQTKVAETLFYNWRGELPIPEEGLDRDDQKRFSVQWAGILTAPETREYTFEVRNESGRAKLYVDDKLIAHNDQGNRVDWNDMGRITLKAGKKYEIRVEYAKIGANADFRLGWDYENEAWLDEAVSLAKESDAVLLTVGLSGNMGETEAGDRKRLSLFPAQERLINAVANANPNTAVALIAGSAVTMDAWLGNAPSVLMVWYPGQEGGHALADLIFGDVNPAGRLPITFPKSIEQYPADFYTRERSITYREGIFVGYRYFDQYDLDVLFPFGHGLSYTTFTYGEPTLNKTSAKIGDPITVSLSITNTGTRSGAEVVQLYVHDVKSSVPRPPKELKAFKKIALKPGETKTVTLELDKRSFAFFDEKGEAWKVEPGQFELLIGSSSRDIRQKTSCHIK